MSGINWGDAPTWLAVFIAAGGGAVALIQLRQQGNVLKGEVQRNKRRDELLDGQLGELQLSEKLRERRQAEQIDFTWNNSGAGSVAQVVNDSRRPIRNVACFIRLRNGDIAGADLAAELMPIAREGVSGWAAPREAVIKGASVFVVRGGGRASFEFHTIKRGGGDGAWLLLRFTDDAGLHWSLDHDLHLARLDNRDDW